MSSIGHPPGQTRLLVVLADPLSPLITKGEVTERYYNPGDVFDEVHFLLLNADRPDVEAVVRMCGRARCSLQNLPLPGGLFARSAGWQPILMGALIAEARSIAAGVAPDLIRCYGAGLNALFTNAIGEALGKPTLVSLHNRPDIVIADTLGERLRQRAQASLARKVLRRAANVVCVYQAQVGYLEAIGVAHRLIYNVVGFPDMPSKPTYQVGAPARILSVGRLLPGKDISCLIGAVAALPGVELTVVGDGPLRAGLVGLARSLGAAERIKFERAWSNDTLCRRLADYDIFAAHNDYPGLPKAVMEPMLAGVPVVMNSQGRGLNGELEGAAVLVENSVEGYRAALADLLANEGARAQAGKACRAVAARLWEPARTEAQHAALHRELAGLSP